MFRMIPNHFIPFQSTKKTTNSVITMKTIIRDTNVVMTALAVSKALSLDNSMVVLLYASTLSNNDSIESLGVSIFLIFKNNKHQTLSSERNEHLGSL